MDKKHRAALYFGPPDLGFHAGARLPPLTLFLCVFRPLYPPIRPALTGGPQQQSPLPKIELSEGSLPLPPAGKGNGSKKKIPGVSLDAPAECLTSNSESGGKSEARRFCVRRRKPLTAEKFLA